MQPVKNVEESDLENMRPSPHRKTRTRRCGFRIEPVRGTSFQCPVLRVLTPSFARQYVVTSLKAHMAHPEGINHRVLTLRYQSYLHGESEPRPVVERRPLSERRGVLRPRRAVTDPVIDLAKDAGHEPRDRSTWKVDDAFLATIAAPLLEPSDAVPGSVPPEAQTPAARAASQGLVQPMPKGFGAMRSLLALGLWRGLLASDGCISKGVSR